MVEVLQTPGDGLATEDMRSCFVVDILFAHGKLSLCSVAGVPVHVKTWIWLIYMGY